jgi:arylsulfatase A-like enzyme
MKANKCIFPGFAVALILSGCQQKAPPESQAAVFRLFDLFQPEDLTGKVTPEDAGWKRVEWRVQDMAPWTPPPKSDDDSPKPVATPAPALGFRALNDVTELKTAAGQLTGDITGPAPVLHFALKENRGGAESVKFIEVRMNVSGAKQVWLRPEGSAALDDDPALVGWASQTNAWDTSVDVEENKLHTYRFEIRSNRGSGGGRGGPPGAGGPGMGGPGGGGRGGGGSGLNPGDLRHFLLTFREGKSAKFSIESVRFVSEKEEKLKEASGQQWAGLAEIYHATLAAKTPESIKIPVRELPQHARLDFAFGTREDTPVKFKITVSDRDNSKESSPAVLFERTVTIPNRWQTERIDLAAYEGKSILLEFALAGEKKGLWGYWGSPTIRSHRTALASTIAKGGSSEKRKPRGVIFLVTDTLRKDHLNIYGYPRETVVHLKRFADEGVAFSHAISQGTWTKVSIPSMVTSLYPLSHTVLGMEKGLPASAKTIAEVFREEGYATVAFSSVPFTGKMNNMHQGYEELHESSSVSDNEYRAKTARPFVDRLIPWLKEHKDAPFFVFLHVFDPHSPFRPRPPYDTLWGAPGAKDRLVEIEADMKKHKVGTSPVDNLPHKAEYLKTGNDPDELLKIYKDWYDGSIRGMDAEIGRLLEALREMGLDQDTLIVWSADHGEEFWEHGKMFHGQSVYGELNQVPLVFRWPNNPDIRKGAMVDQQIENIDIMPTILELAGIAGPTNMQGRSLLPLLKGSGAATWEERPALTQTMVRDEPPGGTPSGAPRPPEKPHFGIINRGWKLVRKEVEPEAQQELYEHPIDSLNLTNVITSDGSASHVMALADALEAWKSRAGAAQLPSDETMTTQLSSEELRRLRALGYIGGGTPARPATNNAANPATNATTNAASNTNAPTGAGAGQ